MPTWPADLPQRVLRDGYKETPPDLALRTQMDAGIDKVRRRFTAGVRMLDIRIKLAPSQVGILDAFYLEDCAGGSVPFDWVHPRTGASATFRFGDGPPEYTPRGIGYVAAFSLEILP